MGRSVAGPFRRPLFDNSRDLLVEPGGPLVEERGRIFESLRPCEHLPRLLFLSKAGNGQEEAKQQGRCPVTTAIALVIHARRLEVGVFFG